MADQATFGDARGTDSDDIAALHADNWRRHDGGACPDEFLDRPVFADRRAVWTERLSRPHRDAFTLVAEHQGRIVGFRAHRDRRRRRVGCAAR